MAQNNSEGMQLIWRAALAGVAAVVVTLALWLLTELGFGGALIIGAILALLTFVFTGMAGGEPVVRYEDNLPQTPAPTVPKAAPTVEATAPSAPPASPSTEEAPAPEAAPVEEESSSAAAVEAADATATAEADDAAEPAEDTAAADDTASDADPAPAEEVASGDDEVAETTPGTLYTDAPDDADDLKRIKGVGPGLEKTLNELGVYKFDQIMTWGAAEVAWVDARLKFKGRITRDDWISQAKTFAAEKADGGGAS